MFDFPLPCKPTTLALHGFMGQTSMWNPVIEHIPDVSLTPLALPGHGPHGELSSATAFDEVVDTLAARLKNGAQCHIVGYSMGARIALRLALRHPHTIKSALLVGVNAGFQDPKERTARRQWDAEQAVSLSSDLSQFVHHWEAMPLFQSQRTLNENTRAAQRAQRLEHNPAALAWAMKTLGQGNMPNCWPQLTDCRVPIHLIVGSLDHKYKTIMQQLAAHLPRCKTTIIPKTGHNPVLEAPDKIAQLIRSNSLEQLP